MHWGAIGHAARRVRVEGGFTLGGGAVGYAATGTIDGTLMGASMGQAIGGAFGNFAVACFTAGTPLVVDMEGNSRPIDEIEVGDFVLARSEFDPDGPLELKRVEEKSVRTAVVMELVVRGQSMKTTAEHPFYVPLYRGGPNSFENLRVMRQSFHHKFREYLHNYPVNTHPNASAGIGRQK